MFCLNKHLHIETQHAVDRNWWSFWSGIHVVKSTWTNSIIRETIFTINLNMTILILNLCKAISIPHWMISVSVYCPYQNEIETMVFEMKSNRFYNYFSKDTWIHVLYLLWTNRFFFLFVLVAVNSCQWLLLNSPTCGMLHLMLQHVSLKMVN